MFVPAVPCPTCGRRLRLRFETDGAGQLVEHVEPCGECARPKQRRAWPDRVDVERRRACICQRCDRPVTGKPRVALYCDRHRREARREAQAEHRAKVGNAHGRAYYRRHRAKVLAKAKRRHRTDAAERERRNAYKREWRRRNPDKVRAQKRRAALRRGGETPASIVRWRAEVRAGVREPTRARRNAKGERLCLTPDCGAVLRGRAKKCEACKRREVVTNAPVREAA